MPYCVFCTHTTKARSRIGRRSRGGSHSFYGVDPLAQLLRQAYIGHVSRLVAIAVRFCGGPGHASCPTIAQFQTQVITAHW